MPRPRDTSPRGRRAFVTGGAGWVAAACAPAAGPASRRPTGPLLVSLADHPELTRPGGRAEITAPGAAHPILLRCTAPGTVLALSLACPHARCTVRPDPSGDGLRCPCHGSRFSADGARLSGPAPRGLTRLPVRAGDRALAIDLERLP